MDLGATLIALDVGALHAGSVRVFQPAHPLFDEVLLREAAQGIDQLVVLGVGFDSRSLRFAPQLGAARVFEVDRPEVLARRAERLRGISQNPHALAVPTDFDLDNLADVLTSKGFVTRGVRSLFLWEGVTYYLPESAVNVVLACVATLSEAPSSIVFDYVTRAFYEGDERGHGAAPPRGASHGEGRALRNSVGHDAALRGDCAQSPACGSRRARVLHGECHQRIRIARRPTPPAAPSLGDCLPKCLYRHRPRHRVTSCIRRLHNFFNSTRRWLPSTYGRTLESLTPPGDQEPRALRNLRSMLLWRS